MSRPRNRRTATTKTEPCKCQHEARAILAAADVSDDEWDGAPDGYDDDQWEAAAAACDAGEAPVKERCFLPHHEPDGTLNRNGVHAAAGEVGDVDADPAAVEKAKAHLRAHYEELDEEPPDSLGGGDDQKELDKAPNPFTAAAAEDGTELPERWHAYLVIEGQRTTDHRMFGEESLTWRDLPLALEWNPQGNDHFAAGIVGSIDMVERQDGGAIYAEGTFDLGSTIGCEAARLCAKQLLRWVSIDAEVTESELVGDPFAGMDDFFFWEQQRRAKAKVRGFHDEAADTVVEDWYEKFTKARIAGAHMVTIPAVPSAIICPLSEKLPTPTNNDDLLPPDPAMVACATTGAAPAAWFADPMLPEPTPVTVLSNGRVYGHLATWGTCHIGFADACVCPPESKAKYAYAQTGRVITADGAQVPCGHLTLGTGHAPIQASHHSAAAHYDDTGTVVADVAFGEDAVGIWFAGTLRQGVTDEQVHALRASAISGDWRSIGGNLELVAALCVNVPGFPIVASAGESPLPEVVHGPRAGMRRYADERVQVSLVAAGIAVPDPMRDYRDALTALERRVEQLNAVIRPLVASARDALVARIDL